MTTFISGVTDHSLQRAKERLSKNEKEACTYIIKAMERGTTSDAFRSQERMYLQNKENAYPGTKIRVYDGNCFVFTADTDDEICLTLFPLPGWFGKKKHYIGKTMIRNPRKYSRYFPVS